MTRTDTRSSNGSTARHAARSQQHGMPELAAQPAEPADHATQPPSPSAQPRRATARIGASIPSDGAGAGPLPDLAFYERLIDDGIAEADAQGTAVDHVTARRLAIWLAARPQHPDFVRGLVRFVNTGAVSDTLKTQLRLHARSGTHPDRPEAAHLLHYCTTRNAGTAPVGEDFGAICDQIDRADLMLADLRDRTRHAPRHAEQPTAETDGPQVIAMAHRDPHGRTVSLVMDATTANVAMFAIAAHAEEREAHLREVEKYGQNLPEGSYGRANRQAIAAREARLAARLRAVEHAYRTALDPDAESAATERARMLRVADRVPDWEMELD